MALTIVSSAGTVTFLDWVVAHYRTNGAYWLNKRGVSEERYAFEHVTAPSVSGHITKTHNFREQDILPIIVEYVAASRALALSAWKTDHDKMVNRACEVTLPNFPAAFSGCYLRSFPCGEPKDTGVSYRLRSELTFRKVR